MALSANRIVLVQKQPFVHEVPVVSGVLHVYRGALLEYKAGNIGYAIVGTDPQAVTLHEFAGIAMEELDVTAAQNTADGTYKVRTLSRGCGEVVTLPVTSTITVANVGDPVYVDNDEYVDLAAGTINTTGGFVGIIREFVSANLARVQLTQHPTL